jgi:hypothetical protein
MRPTVSEAASLRVRGCKCKPVPQKPRPRACSLQPCRCLFIDGYFLYAEAERCCVYALFICVFLYKTSYLGQHKAANMTNLMYPAGGVDNLLLCADSYKVRFVLYSSVNFQVIYTNPLAFETARII